MSDFATTPHDSDQPQPYEPPALEVLGTLADLTWGSVNLAQQDVEELSGNIT